MLSRPDSQSFTRLLISAGTFLLIAAFVVPGLILRDTDVLTISEQDLRRLTPTAERQIEHRQELAGDAGDAAPYVCALFLICGGVLLALGVPRLWRLEQGDDERRRMELDKLRRELRPQSDEEKRERLRKEVAKDEPGKTVPPSAETRLRRTADAEQAVLARLAELAPPDYDLESRVVVGTADRRLFLDGLLISKVGRLPDIVVEVKYVSPGIAEVGRRIREARMQLLHNLASYGRPSIGWLIVVSEERPTFARQNDFEKMTAETDPVLRLSVVRLGELDRLVLPT